MSWFEMYFQLFSWGQRPGSAVNVINDSMKDRVRFVVISDTHNLHQHLQIPDGDVIIHAGDFTNKGSLREVDAFANWFLGLPHRYKILVPGNHDMIMDKGYYDDYWGDWSSKKEVTSRKDDVDASAQQISNGLSTAR